MTGVSRGHRDDGWTITYFPSNKTTVYTDPDGQEFKSQKRAREHADKNGIRFDKVMRRSSKRKPSTALSTKPKTKRRSTPIAKNFVILKESLTRIGGMLIDKKKNSDPDNELLQINNDLIAIKDRSKQHLLRMTRKRCQIIEDVILQVQILSLIYLSIIRNTVLTSHTDRWKHA